MITEKAQSKTIKSQSRVINYITLHNIIKSIEVSRSSGSDVASLEMGRSHPRFFY